MNLHILLLITFDSLININHIRLHMDMKHQLHGEYVTPTTHFISVTIQYKILHIML